MRGKWTTFWPISYFLTINLPSVASCLTLAPYPPMGTVRLWTLGSETTELKPWPVVGPGTCSLTTPSFRTSLKLRYNKSWGFLVERGLVCLFVVCLNGCVNLSLMHGEKCSKIHRLKICQSKSAPCILFWELCHSGSWVYCRCETRGSEELLFLSTAPKVGGVELAYKLDAVGPQTSHSSYSTCPVCVCGTQD